MVASRLCPRVTWGREVLGVGQMWNSRSFVSWLLERDGHDLRGVRLSAGGPAPDWDAGRVVPRRNITTGTATSDLGSSLRSAPGAVEHAPAPGLQDGAGQDEAADEHEE